MHSSVTIHRFNSIRDHLRRHRPAGSKAAIQFVEVRLRRTVIILHIQEVFDLLLPCLLVLVQRLLKLGADFKDLIAALPVRHCLFHRFLDVHEDVVAFGIADVVFGQLARQPLLAVDVDLDRQGKPDCASSVIAGSSGRRRRGRA